MLDLFDSFNSNFNIPSKVKSVLYNTLSYEKTFSASYGFDGSNVIISTEKTSLFLLDPM